MPVSLRLTVRPAHWRTANALDESRECRATLSFALCFHRHHRAVYSSTAHLSVILAMRPLVAFTLLRCHQHDFPHRHSVLWLVPWKACLYLQKAGGWSLPAHLCFLRCFPHNPCQGSPPSCYLSLPKFLSLQLPTTHGLKSRCLQKMILSLLRVQKAMLFPCSKSAV